ncbi:MULTISPECIES: class I SAM-dependent methyltransferase [Brucella/Ochrobactrum group]|uniref:Class I SAM-dependent methyltransferase n=1 Tax=Brucella pseudintermedia TaxID=370111 RepID=A0ABY5UCP7_9HYPH|nr:MULTISPECIES: class I SAM-dependent methyltransferase [Brucella/Ochrobactrum group]KAB2685298.1 class I SAM-dependent methyltransferase [Brucella pseudintermedia]MCO7725618.1 class I SAM-dependent methyltransferase [Brucella intermedia]NKE76840.1 class I SAM-dependent methyltransferase [Ochrobactrum sp. MC-1LL]TWG98812.1 S-adenosylmethionine-diacylgycerolhomoserine-N-methyltransferase [Ochrobactrum sp. J50]UWL61106.1 class I SAM-dependent methyltransferase [Brucella pseudintermedia]
MLRSPWSIQGIDHASLMDRVYRRQRHFYDATRKYYLLGRDPMIAGLAVPKNGTVLEIGCGTGRNLVKTAEHYPDARLFGIDISAEMLDTARRAAERAGIESRVRLERADAAQFDPERLFGQTGFDRIFISYAVSMIPQWQSVVRESIRHLAPQGELHIVDFGDQARLPGWFKRALYTWLEWFRVTPRNDLLSFCEQLASERGFSTEQRILYRGFAWIITAKAIH